MSKFGKQASINNNQHKFGIPLSKSTSIQIHRLLLNEDNPPEESPPTIELPLECLSPSPIPSPIVDMAQIYEKEETIVPIDAPMPKMRFIVDLITKRNQLAKILKQPNW